MKDRSLRKRRYKIAVLATDHTPPEIAAALGYSERHVDMTIASDRPLPGRMAEGLEQQLGQDVMAFVVGERTLVVQPSLEAACRSGAE